MKLFDTYTKSLREFKPIREDKVIMYVCGLTPYDEAHIGHARTYIAFDVLKRYLIFKGYRVIHIQNITDIDDKLINKAKETGQDPLIIAKKYHDLALELFNLLNIIPADYYPKVSDHLNEIENIVIDLINKGYAYNTSTGVYFDISKFERYGKLSNQSLEQINKHRIEPDPTKKNASDFALWKYTNDYKWTSRLGEGRPGWHIECSAMALKYSQGETLDIHGGARDLIFPHHENEIAQSECYTGKKFSNFWIHTGFLTVNGEKMSKSLKNFITIREILEKFHPMALRFLLISSKYSSPLDYSEEFLLNSYQSYLNIKNFYLTIKNSKPAQLSNSLNLDKLNNYIKLFFKELDNDLNTPGALAVLFELISYFNSVDLDKATKSVLIKFLDDVLFILGLSVEDDYKQKLDKLLENLSKYRAELRKNKKFNESDKIRELIQDSGIIVKDNKDKSEYIY